MEKFNGMTAVWGDQNEKYLRTVVLYKHGESDYLTYKHFDHMDDDHVNHRVKTEDLEDMFMKGVILIELNGVVYTPNKFDKESGMIYFDTYNAFGYKPAE